MLLPSAVGAQSLAESLTELARENGEPYIAPVFEGLGTALNTGFTESAAVHGPLGFDVGIRVMGAFVPPEKETFRAVLPSSVTVTFGGTERTYTDPYAPAAGSLETPTAVGSGSGIRIIPTGALAADLESAGEDPGSDRWALEFPDGADIPAVPFVVLQGSVGLGFNTDVTIRLIPSVEPHEDVGSVQAFGIGAKHEVTGWFPGPTPVDVSVNGGYQNFQVGDYIDARTTTFSLLVGKGLGPLNVYALARTVSPSVDVAYTVENPEGNPGLPPDGTRIDFSPDLDSEARVGLGANLKFLVLNVSGEYTLGEYDVASLKVGFSFR